MNIFSALDWQRKIYLSGFSGKLPRVPVDIKQLEESARKNMSPQAFAYIAGGAGCESTMQSNRSDFEKYKIIPRMLRNVGERDTRIELFGQALPSPLLISPIGVLEMVNAEADCAVGRAAARLNMPYIFSNQASRPMEEVAAVMGNSPRWFQLYWSKSKELVASFVKRAEQCGCQAIVVTLDTTMLGWRTRDLDVAYLPFLEGKGIAQYTRDPVFQKLMEEPETSDKPRQSVSMQSIMGLIEMVNNYPGKGFFGKLRSGKPIRAVQKFISTYSNPNTTWNDLSFLRAQTKLPILLKGILHPDDARKALDFGMDGIIVSNHGGRQVDGSISTIEALPGVVEVVNKKIPVLLDSGIRGGADAFKAIALGATAVCIGRPYVYGLTLAGEEGVYEVLRNFMADFELTMGLTGCRNIGEITREMLQTGG
ncbi:MAG: lactate 2-monooxygenase [Cyclobacteriaceae bacterium]|nr:lactate 2-monooxygenase [Cyclobacteriaceae bacterium]